MSIAPVSMGSLPAGLAGIQRASDLFNHSAGQILEASLGRPADLEGAMVDQSRAVSAMSASVAVVEMGDERLEELISLFAG